MSIQLKCSYESNIDRNYILKEGQVGLEFRGRAWYEISEVLAKVGINSYTPDT